MEPSLKAKRKLLLKQQTKLREIMEAGDQPDLAMEIFFQQHAQLHRRSASGLDSPTYSDSVLEDLTPTIFRRIPGNSAHSIAWCLWHISRIEDATMNLLVDGGKQVFNRNDWKEELGVSVSNTGNGMRDEDIVKLSKAIHIEALLSYRDAVGGQTRQIAARLTPAQLTEMVCKERIKRLLAEGVLLDEDKGLADYWGNRTIAGLLLMPATRHNLSHLNEILKLSKARS
jgi:hypothetical protein